MKVSRMTQRVEHEVKIHYQLKHPSILELYTFFEDKNYVYLVLELCNNGEMGRFMKSRQKPFDEDETRHYLKQVVDGMLYLHSYGILHRDLTLSNLLLTKEMNVKISDFGLATRLNIPDEKHFTMCGTPNFISPEIASRNAHGLEADVWSLGCMMYTFLTGKPPFDTDGIRNTLNRVVHADYEIPDYLSAEAKDLISCLLKKNPHDRLPLSKVLDHPFMTNVSGKKNSLSRVQASPSPINTTIASLSSNSMKAVVSGGGSFNESIDSGRGTLTTSTTSQRSSLNNKNSQISSTNTLTGSINCGASNCFSSSVTKNQETNITNKSNVHQNQSNPISSTSSILSSNSGVNSGFSSLTHTLPNSNITNPSSLNHSVSSSTSSSISSSIKNNIKQACSNSNNISNNNSNTTSAFVDLPDNKNFNHNRFLKNQQSSQTPLSPPVKLTSNSPTKDKSSFLTSSTGFNSNNLAHQTNNKSSQGAIFYNQLPKAQPSNLSSSQHNSYVITSNENNQNSFIHNTSSTENMGIATFFPKPSLNSKPNHTSSENITNILNNTTLNQSSSIDPCSINVVQKLNSFHPNNELISTSNLIPKKAKKSIKTEEQNQTSKQSIQEHIFPLKTGSTLLRPTRQAAKNAVVIELKFTNHSNRFALEKPLLGSI
jgi:serine/threonine protein kinase